MLGILDYWRQEAQGLYRQLPEGDDISNREKYKSSGASSPQFIFQKIYRVAPCLLLLNLVVTAFWAARGVSHIFNRPRRLVPDSSITTMILEENATFMAPALPESDAAWEALRPKEGGAIAVPNAKAYGLKPGIPMETGADVYGVSMFHQLHCLTVLRASYYAALNSTLPGFHQPGIELVSEEKNLMLIRGHTAHCYDYIRQVIMCAGGMTIESAVKFPKKWLEGISGDILREKYGGHKPVL